MDGGPVLHGEMSDWFLPVMDDSRAAGFLRNVSERDEWTPQLDELTEYGRLVHSVLDCFYRTHH